MKNYYFILLTSCFLSCDSKFNYPKTVKINVIDEYNRKIIDPYRWLEDDMSGTPISKTISQYADIYGFTLSNMGFEDLP